MRWTYAIKNKLIAATLLSIVLLVVLLNNLQERNNSRKLQDDFVSLFEDRLLVEQYILQLSAYMHQIIQTTAYEHSDSTFRAQHINELVTKMDTLTILYKATKLTTQEEIEFNQLKKTIAEIKHQSIAFNEQECKLLAQDALTSLTALSDIQISEGKNLKNHSERIFNAGFFTSKFEMAMLIIVAVLILALIFSSRTLRTYSTNQTQQLN
jgi:hypothetical protein